MRIHIVTLFPEAFPSFLESALLGKAIDAERLEVTFANPRDHTTDRHRTVDDTPYGGGSGMVMMPGPIAAALDALPTTKGTPAHRILLTPQGKTFRQEDAERLAQMPSLALVCGRYEGVDERVRPLVDEEISLGDFVLFGGEVAAHAAIEAITRLLPGVLGNRESTVDESHAAGTLEYPQYTRPADFRGMGVPEILRSGDHGAIARWRRKEALRRTRDRRPDLLRDLELSEEDRALLRELDSETEA